MTSPPSTRPALVTDAAASLEYLGYSCSWSQAEAFNAVLGLTRGIFKKAEVDGRVGPSLGKVGILVLLPGKATWPVCPPGYPGPAHSAGVLGSRGWSLVSLAPSAFSHCIFCWCCWMASWTRASIMASVRTPSSEAYAMAWQGKRALMQGTHRGYLQGKRVSQPQAFSPLAPPVTRNHPPCQTQG